MYGDIEFYSDTSLVRLILEDVNGFQYMIYESYPLISTGSNFTADEYCDETCALDDCHPYSLIIQVTGAEIFLRYLSYDSDPKQFAEDLRYEAKRAKDVAKIEIMNEQILLNGMTWVAGDNQLVGMYYNEKKELFGEGYNTLGYEYYQSGVFEFVGHGEYPRVDPDLVKEFDWRSRHGANNPDSPYWDGDIYGTGWLTEVKNQSGNCKSCWAFSAVGVAEAMMNLYAVDSLDFNLSEQFLISCCTIAGNCIDGGWPKPALECIQSGIVTEYCFPYYDDDVDCNSMICEQPDPILRIEGYSFIPEDFDSIRVNLVKHGPLTLVFPVTPNLHAVVLVGFRYNVVDSTITWIYKDSYPTGPPNYGFKEIKLENITDTCYFAEPPGYIIYDTTTSPIDTLVQHCYDKDLDGFFFWGIGPKPDTLESLNPEDCDDSNPFVGGYDENYNCMCLIEYNSTAIHISSDTAWSDSLIVQNPIIIDSGACLTITAYVNFHPDVKVTVDKGGKLILDGGLLTNSCPDLWEGIDVLGSDTAQYYSQYFGVLEIKDGGTIENARVAVSNYCKACEYQDAGGIINADDGIFRNNQVAFEFAPFSNIYQGTERPYLGSFERCRFIYDEFLQDYGDFRYFIKLNEVNGITIKGCEFACDTISLDPRTERSLKYKSGIYSTGSHFSVDEACEEDILPCPGYVPCVFKGLNYGIYALGITGTEVISIKKSNFISNRTGIYLSGENYATIVQDTFKVFYEKKSMDTICGLYLDYCTGYQVEENHFQGNYKYQVMQWPSKCVGITINNSGEEYNEIYNNRFDSLFIGTLSQNVNRDARGKIGLQILCNDYTKGYYDISVTSNDTVGINGIADNQGSDGSEWTSPANNTFSYSKPINNNEFSDYFNECEDLIYWYLKDTLSANLKPKYYSFPEVNPQYNSNNNLYYEKDSCCPSSFSPGGGELLLETRAQMNSYLSKSDSISSLINIFEDGGNTFELRTDILTSSQEDANNLYEMLLDYSPYLSDSVMVASVEKETVLNADMITGVLSENPQAAKSDTVQFVLGNRMDELSEEQRIAIDQGWFITGDLERMNSIHSYYNRKHSTAYYSLARTYKSDTSMVNSFDSLASLYQEYPSLKSKYDLVFEYAEKGDSCAAFSALSAIPGNYLLDNGESEFHQQVEQYLSILSTYLTDNDFNDLDSIQSSNLQSLSHSGIGQIKALARNVLLSQNQSNYNEPFLFPLQTLKSDIIKRMPVKMNTTLPSMVIYPNPANNTVQIELINPDYHSGGVLKVFDLTGRLISSIKINKWQKSIIINTEALNQGAYLMNYYDNSGNTQSRKLIISD